MNERGSSHRGFAFVEYETAEDAQAAMDNMNLSELLGKLIKVNLARQGKYNELQTQAGTPSNSVWDDIEFRAKIAKTETPALKDQASALSTNESNALQTSAKAGENPKVYFEIKINGAPQGRITFLLYQNIVPRM